MCDSLYDLSVGTVVGTWSLYGDLILNFSKATYCQILNTTFAGSWKVGF